jgi:DNA-binding SARP family transcriptional activator/WD40 repeat protein
MNIRMLGPFTVEVNGSAIKLAGPKQRAVLSLLAMRANGTLSVDQLVDALWGDRPPASAEKMVQQYVSQLRRLLGEADGPEILTRGRGYELAIDPSAVDVLRFEQIIDGATRAANGERGALAREALALWRGPPFADLKDEPFAAAEGRRLEELQLRATELVMEGDLEAGRHAEVIADLRALVDAYPLRERLRGLLMLALYRAGRQAEGLNAFQDARRTLVEELGLEPGPELRRLQEAILRQDPALERVVPDAAWASRETVQQVGAGAGRISQARGALRADERELAANVVDLHTLRGRAARPATAQGCPYKGLESFDVGDAEVYFGRENLVAQIVARLPGTSVLGVIGPSGSGKSSAVRAGLVPALSGGVLPGSERWTRALMRPGEQPLMALRRALRTPPEVTDPIAAALDGVPADSRLLLVVDQFEETFIACRDDTQRAAFLDALVGPAARGDARYLVVLVLRADYYGACAAHPQLARLLEENHVLVGAMQPEELERAIEGPAQRAGLEVEPGLVARLVEETAGRPGGLPLLSTTLLELWLGAADNRLTVAAYGRTGGVQGAVARLAETAYQCFDEHEAAIARNLLLRLASVGEPGPAVRRQVPLSELDLTRSAAAQHVLDVLTENRLITVDSETVEVAHEALLREWPRLREWMDSDAEARRLHRHITFAARDWDAGGRDTSELYRGARLASALDFAAEHEDALNALERDFLAEARMVSEREALRSRALNRRLRALLVGALVALVAAAGAGVLALNQRGEARDAALTADAQRIGAQALTEEHPDRALLLARAGVALDDSVTTRGSLLATLFRQPPALLGVFDSITDAEVYSLAVSPAGDRMAVADSGGRVHVFELPSRRSIGTYRIGVATNVTFSADSRTLAVGGELEKGKFPGGVVDLVEARTLRRRQRIALPALADPEAFVAPTPLFAADGDLLVLQTPFGGRPQPHVLRRFDARSGSPIGQPLELPAGASYAPMIAGERVFVPHPGRDVTYEVDAARMRIVRRHPAGGAVGTLHPDGRHLALTTDDGGLRVLDLDSGRTQELEGNRRAIVNDVRYTPDGRTIITAAEDGSVAVWDAASGSVRERIAAHTEAASRLSVMPDGRSVLSGGADAHVFLWDITGVQRLVRSVPLGMPFEVPDDPTPRGSALSPDGRTLAVAEAGGTAALIDTRTMHARTTVQAGNAPLVSAAFSPDGELLALADTHGSVTLWDPATGAARGRLEGLDASTQALAFSPDGRRIAAAEAVSPTMRVWDVARRTPTSFRADALASALAFSPDGRQIAAAGNEVDPYVRDARTGRLITELKTPALPRSVAYSPDGRLLFVGLENGQGQFFSTADWRPVGAPIRGQEQRLTAAQFTPDGRTLATASADGTVMLWDVATRKPIGTRMVVEPQSYMSAVISPDGRFLFALPTGRAGIRVDLSPEFWKTQACRIAGRQLTEGEWADAVPEQPYRRVC